MSNQLLIISERAEDLRFGEFLAFANDLPVAKAVMPADVRAHLLEYPGSVVLWGTAEGDGAADIAEILRTGSQPARTFLITDNSLSSYPGLAALSVFGHHLFRRYGAPAPALYARLIGASLHKRPFGLSRYFPEGAQQNTIQLTRSGQKRAAVEAIQSIFTKQSVNARLSSLIAQAVDELLMNAIFDAPVLPNGMPLRRGTDRGADFEMIEQEYVRLEVASGDDYVGISVTDQFGSMKKSVLMDFLSRNYQDQNYVVRQADPGAGLGLHGMIQSGLSMMFLSEPGVKSEVMIFFARGASYKNFRGGFRFLSVLAP